VRNYVPEKERWRCAPVDELWSHKNNDPDTFVQVVAATVPHHLSSQQLFFAHGSQLVQYNVGVNITTGETLAILIRIYQTTTKTEDALQQKRVQLPAVLIRKKKNRQDYTMDS
jgi:hypothetical protein